jgi:hypothetical protein
MNKKDSDYIGYHVQEIIVLEIGDSKLEARHNRMYDESDEKYTFIDNGETIGIYASKPEIVQRIISKISKKFKVDLSDWDKNRTIRQLINFIYEKL